MVGLLCMLVSLVVAALAAPQHNAHLHSLPGFSVWQQHIQAVRQAEARLGERATGATSSLPATEVDGIPEDVDTREGLKTVIKNIVKNNLESLEDEVEEPAEKSQVDFMSAPRRLSKLLSILLFLFASTIVCIKCRLNSCLSEQP